jgi:hypothetical protein
VDKQLKVEGKWLRVRDRLLQLSLKQQMPTLTLMIPNDSILFLIHDKISNKRGDDVFDFFNVRSIILSPN